MDWGSAGIDWSILHSSTSSCLSRRRYFTLSGKFLMVQSYSLKYSNDDKKVILSGISYKLWQKSKNKCVTLRNPGLGNTSFKVTKVSHSCFLVFRKMYETLTDGKRKLSKISHIQNWWWDLLSSTRKELRKDRIHEALMWQRTLEDYSNEKRTLLGERVSKCCYKGS
jgi:hypothetical protein